MNCLVHVHSGQVFDVFHPDPGMVEIGDIAHALAFQCRFNGHVRFHYSVGQHSLLVSELAETRYGRHLALAALLHDAAEAYLPDVVTPLKERLPGFKDLERVVEGVIAKRFGLVWPLPPEIKELDLAILSAEREQVVSPTDRTAWRVLPVPADVVIWPSEPQEIERLFLERFEELRSDPCCSACCCS